MTRETTLLNVELSLDDIDEINRALDCLWLTLVLSGPNPTSWGAWRAGLKLKFQKAGYTPNTPNTPENNHDR